MIIRVQFTTTDSITQPTPRQERARQRYPGTIVNIQGEAQATSAARLSPEAPPPVLPAQLIMDKQNNSKERANWMRYYCTPFSNSADTAIGIICDTKAGRRGQTFRIALTSVDTLGKDEENCCPITLDTFQNSDVDFLPGERIIRNKPELCIAVLPCGHKCGAVPVLYHMLISGVKCPMCRQGPGLPMRFKCVPPHLRDAMHKQETRIRREEVMQQNRDSRQLVQQLMSEMHMEQYGVSVMFPPEVSVSVFFYTTRSMLPSVATLQPNAVRAVYSCEYQVRQVSPTDFAMDHNDVRQLNEYMTTLGCTSARFISHCKEGDDEPEVLSNSGIFDIDQLQVYPNTSPATFIIDSSNQGEFVLSRSRPLVETYSNQTPIIVDNVRFRLRSPPQPHTATIQISMPHLDGT